MQVVFVNTNKIWGGGEKWHSLMAQRLRDYPQIETAIVAQKHTPLYDKMIPSGIPVYPFKTGNLSFLNPIKIYRLYQFFRRHQTDVVVFGLPKDLKCGGLSAKLAGVKKIIYARALAAPVKNSMMNRLLFRRVVTHVVCNSRETLKQMVLKNAELIPESKRHIIYYGLEDPYRGAVSQPANATFIIGNAGRLTAQKAQHLFVSIAQELKSKGLDFQIYIAGDGELKAALEHQVKEANLENQFCFLGFVADVPAFMSSIDVFCLTSLWEGFGYVIAEAHLAQKPVVAFDVSSNPEVVEHEKDGFLVSSEDTAAMAEKLFLLAQNAPLRKEMGISGRNKVLEKFSAEKELEEWGKLILN